MVYFAISTLVAGGFGYLSGALIRVRILKRRRVASLRQAVSRSGS